MVNARIKQKKTRKFAGRYLLFGFVVLGVAYAGAWVWYEVRMTDAFPIKHVAIEGSIPHIEKMQLVTGVKETLTGNFFSLRLSSVKARLLANQWVDQVAFRRVWPDTLIVTVIEKPAIARWKQGSVVEPSGKIFSPDISTIPQSLPVLSGPDGQSKQVLQRFEALNLLLKPLSLSVSSLSLSPEGAWGATLSNHIAVQMGDQQVVPRFKRLVRVYHKLQALAPRQVTAIDLRYPNGFSVSYAEPKFK